MTIPDRLFENSYSVMKKCRYGYMTYNRNDLFIGRSLDTYGEWAQEELDLMGKLIRPGNIVVDVGANIGTHTVFFAQNTAPNGRVYAFEPQNINFAFLCANIALNALYNAFPIKAAAGDQPGKLKVPILDPKVPNNFGGLNVEGHQSGDTVPVMMVDELDLPSLILLKVDVEGMEEKVLRGAQKTILKHRPFLFIENNTDEGSPQTVELLLSYGYRCWWFMAPYYNPGNFFGNPENIFPRVRPDASLLCIPKEAPIKIEGFIPVIDAGDTWIKAAQRASLAAAKSE